VELVRLTVPSPQNSRLILGTSANLSQEQYIIKNIISVTLCSGTSQLFLEGPSSVPVAFAPKDFFAWFVIIYERARELLEGHKSKTSEVVAIR
jgi:hypothetical protein